MYPNPVKTFDDMEPVIGPSGDEKITDYNQVPSRECDALKAYERLQEVRRIKADLLDELEDSAEDYYWDTPEQFPYS